MILYTRAGNSHIYATYMSSFIFEDEINVPLLGLQSFLKYEVHIEHPNTTQKIGRKSKI